MNPLLQQTYWLSTFALLAGYFGGWPPGLAWAMALTAAQGVQLTLTRRRLRALDVQVRWFYLGLLLLGTMPGMRWLHPLLFAGLMTRLATEYCLAARPRDLPNGAGRRRAPAMGASPVSSDHRARFGSGRLRQQSAACLLRRDVADVT
jgi:hypothetical protein